MRLMASKRLCRKSIVKGPTRSLSPMAALPMARSNGCATTDTKYVVQKKKGIRHAYLEVLPLIRGDVILSFSPDGNCPPAAIPLMLEQVRAGYDLVIGSRYLGDAVSEDDDLVTGFGNWLFTKTI